jgi:hypothetical protein
LAFKVGGILGAGAVMACRDAAGPGNQEHEQVGRQVQVPWPSSTSAVFNAGLMQT